MGDDERPPVTTGTPVRGQVVRKRQRRPVRMLPTPDRRPWLSWSEKSQVDRFLSVCLAAVLTVLAAPGFSQDLGIGLIGGLFYALGIAGIFLWMLRTGNVLQAVLATMVGLAYAVGLGQATAAGIGFSGFSASAASVRLAVGLLVVFYFVSCGVSALGTSVLRMVLGDGGRWDYSRRQWNRAITLGLLSVLVVSFAAALGSGAWTFYGGEASSRPDGSIRLEYLYHPALLSTFAVILHRLANAERFQLSYKAKSFLWLCFMTVYGAIFSTQLRRLMLVSALVAVVAFLRTESGAWRATRLPRKLFVVLVGTAIASVLITLGSSAWRDSSVDFRSNDPVERLTDVSRRAVDNDVAIARIEERLTYLWLDSIAVENASALEGIVALDEMFTSTLWGVIPGRFAPGKYSVAFVSCESAFEAIGFRGMDLPCTPTSEAYLAEGILGIVLLAFVWGIALAIASFAYNRGTALSLTLAMHLFYPMSIVETSAFPMILSARVVAQGMLAIGIFALFWKAVLMVLERGGDIDPRGRAQEPSATVNG